MFDFITVALKNVFSKPATRKYPFEKRAPYERQKGHIAIDIDKCIFCGMCGRKCPVGAIKVDRAGRSWTINRFKCIVCGACSESCPKKCLDIAPEYTAPANVKSSDTFTGKPLPPQPPKAAPAEKAAPVPQSAGVASSNASAASGKAGVNSGNTGKDNNA